MLSRILFPSLLRSTAPAVLAPGIVVILVVMLVAAPATAAEGGLSPLPGVALTNAVLSIDSTEAPPPQQQQEAEPINLRAAVSRDSEMIKNLVYQADGQAPPGQREPYELSLLDAVELALQNNLQVQVARFTPRSSFEGINGARGQFDPNLSLNIPQSFSRGTSPQTTQTSGADIITRQNVNGGFTWSENLEWGTNYNVSWSASRNSDNNQFNFFNPVLSSGLSGRITQPLLNGFGDVNRTGIRVAMNSYDQSLEQFRDNVQSTLFQVVDAYWNLQAAAQQVEVQQESLGLAEQQLERNEIQVEIGTLAPIETVQAEQQASSANLSLIAAQNQLENAQDSLKQLINFDVVVDDPFAYDLVATEEPEQSAAPIDAEEAVQVALDNDPGLAQARIGLRSAELGVAQARNSVLPRLDINASFSLAGRGGTRIISSDNELGGESTEIIETGFGTAISQVLSGDFNTWTIGATLSFPIHNYSAKANAARARIDSQQQQTSYEQQRQAVTYAVRQQVRTVENLVEQVEAATLNRELADRQLQAEQRKFDVGTTTNFNVLSFQEALTSAQLSELQAVLNLQRAIVQLELTKGTLLQYFGVQLGDAGTGGNGSQEDAVQLPAPTGRNR